MKNLISFSAAGTHEYCCSVVKIPEVVPIEGSDFLGKVDIFGETIVVRRDQVREGMLMFYAGNECQLASGFLSANNMYSSSELNANWEEIQSMRRAIEKTDNPGEKADLEEELKGMPSGYFDKHGRVRTVKLRGVQSFGFLFSLAEMTNFCGDFTGFNMEEHVGEDFDTVADELFVQAYVPRRAERVFRADPAGKRNRKLKKFDTIIPGQFMFHYDTQPLGKNYERVLAPDSRLTVSVKAHGTSVILANVKCRIPKRRSLIRAIGNLLAKIGPLSWLRRDGFVVGYRYIWSSRTVIKNQFINKGAAGGGFYDVDVWSYAAEKMKGYIPEGMTVYGELVGYLPGSQTMIQRGYDYGCRPGECRLMPYRITSDAEDGTKREWEVSEVKEWTRETAALMPEGDSGFLMPIEVLYSGDAAGMVPWVLIGEDFPENAFAEIKGMFGLEKDEPLCRTKCPREGIVIRIEGDDHPEAFKYKSVKFMTREAKDMDNAAADIEMGQNGAYSGGSQI